MWFVIFYCEELYCMELLLSFLFLWKFLLLWVEEISLKGPSSHLPLPGLQGPRSFPGQLPRWLHSLGRPHHITHLDFTPASSIGLGSRVSPGGLLIPCPQGPLSVGGWPFLDTFHTERSAFHSEISLTKERAGTQFQFPLCSSIFFSRRWQHE